MTSWTGGKYITALFDSGHVVAGEGSESFFGGAQKFVADMNSLPLIVQSQDCKGSMTQFSFLLSVWLNIPLAFSRVQQSCYWLKCQSCSQCLRKGRFEGSKIYDSLRSSTPVADAIGPTRGCAGSPESIERRWGGECS